MIGRECAQKSAWTAPVALATSRQLVVILNFELAWGKTSHNGCFNVRLAATRGRSATVVASRIIINTCSRPHPPDVTDLGHIQPHLRPTTVASLAMATASRCPSLLVIIHPQGGLAMFGYKPTIKVEIC